MEHTDDLHATIDDDKHIIKQFDDIGLLNTGAKVDLAKQQAEIDERVRRRQRSYARMTHDEDRRVPVEHGTHMRERNSDSFMNYSIEFKGSRRRITGQHCVNNPIIGDQLKQIIDHLGVFSYEVFV